ncbi:catabolic 3-dehydroquinase [Sarocladium strictum]
MSRHVVVINGPNLNLLGTREPHLYGSTTLEEVNQQALKQAEELGITVETFQSNYEGAIIDRIQAARGVADAIIINPAGFTHTSVPIRDALLGVNIPFVEVHVSNVHAREEWRHHSYFTDKAEAMICGFGAFGYTAAIQFAAQHIKLRDNPKAK